MCKGLVSVLVLAAALLGTADRAGSVSVCLLMSPSCPAPTLVPALGVSVSPRALPATGYAPVQWNIFGKIGTRDGGHPSALREAILDVDKDVRINADGYPSCGRREIDAHNTEAAARACPDAIVGRGKASVMLAAPDAPPTLLSSRLLLFNNGTRDGVTKLLVHAFVPVPAPSTMLTVVTISHKGTGLRTVSEIPPIADGMGSLTDFKLRLGRTYGPRGKKVGYFEAKCPDGIFKVNVPKLLFKNEARVPGIAAQATMKGSLAVLCTARG